MKRIFVLGGVGAGKTTFAKELSEVLGIPLYSIDDMIYSKDRKKELSEGTRRKKLKKIVSKNRWIIEGVHTGDWILPAFKRVDTIILLDFNRRILVERVFRRFKKSRKEGGPHGKISSLYNCIKWAACYNRSDYLVRKRFVDKNRGRLIILKNNGQVVRFLNKLR